MLSLQEFISDFCIKDRNIAHNYTNIRINSRNLISFDGKYDIIDNNNNKIDTISFRITIDKNNKHKVQMLNNKDYKKYYLWRKYHVRQDLETKFDYWTYNNKENLAKVFKNKK